MISGARILLECLKRLGVTDMFGYPGGSVIKIYDELHGFQGITHYLARHEQGAAHEADGYARSTGKVGVCLATSGPGATNLVTGIMTAYMDSVPLLAITGQVGTNLLGKDSFQETDIVGITIPVTKYNSLVTDIRELPKAIKEGYFLARTGRPGPVLIDIPKDVQMDSIPESEFEELFAEEIVLEGYEPTYKGHSGQIKRAMEQIRKAKRPLIIAGAGVVKSEASEELFKFAKKAGIPVASSLLGLGGYSGYDEHFLGMVGMHGTTAANFATREADLVIGAGFRFSDRITGKTDEFCKNATIIQIDIDPAEIDKNVKVQIPIVGDLKDTLTRINERLEEELDHSEWLAQVKNWKDDYVIEVPKNGERLAPQYVLAKLNEIIKGDAIVATDVGQHQMWTAQHLTFKNPKSFLSSGGAGTMGFGLPAAIGAQVANRDKKVISISGDGGFQMNIQELMLLKEYNLPVKVIILNNSYLGMVRQWQELFNEKRYSGVNLEFNPDFVMIGQAYGIKSVEISTKEDIETKLKELIESDEAVLINCIVEREENVFPMIPAGGTVDKMIGHRGYMDNE